MPDIPFHNQQQFARLTGDPSQIGGLRRYILADGKAQGVDAVDIRTGSGLSATVLPGRGMDLAWAEFRGIPFAYISKAGMVGPSYYEPQGMGFLRSFYGGLLTTCGLSNAGGPCDSEHPVLGPVHHGLHGRISNMAAADVCVRQGWQEDRYQMEVTGSMRQAQLHGENLLLTRTVTAQMGENALAICDIVQNQGLRPEPLMLLYHINIGYPLLDEGARFYCNSRSVLPGGPGAQRYPDGYGRMDAPIPGEPEHLYFHDVQPDENGFAGAAVYNPALSLGIAVTYDAKELGYFTQWKMPSEAEYVLGIEPGNCLPVSLEGMRKKGLETLAPGQQKSVSLCISVLDGEIQLRAFCQRYGIVHE